MIDVFSDCIESLAESANPLIGLPVAGAGLALMLLGWRMWKICLAATYALLGYGAVMVYLPTVDDPMFYAIALGIMLATTSVVVADQAVGALGGIAGAMVVHHTLMGWGMAAPVVWAVAVLSFTLISAVSYLNRRKVVIVITSFQGGVLLSTGFIVLVKSQASLAEFFSGAQAGNHAIFLPFLVLVPTVIGCLVQGSDIREISAD